ncbi:mannosylglucosyl-3-phosphoglycerate phosphatase isoform X2 [Oratosquilla oratoria]|uniref:mannosylglucosyl-3-phosphoglycerate phosphatase isoform X2 n=1 Tax=Oratosquilla oratoria TaxID=337810 RepID=UPI003F757266
MGHTVSKTLFCVGSKESSVTVNRISRSSTVSPATAAASPAASPASSSTKHKSSSSSSFPHHPLPGAMVVAEKSSTSSSSNHTGPRAPSITLIHFNDVYNVEDQPSEPKAGAARFKSAFLSKADKDPLILFSGDILAPSIMSSFTQGEQMIPVLNQLGVHCAVYGNHDFDFGLERLIEVAEQTNFPWLMSNVEDNETERPLAEGLLTQIIHWHGWKIGLIGLVEMEWLETLATINADQITYTDYVDKGRELATQLKNEGCDYIIALTHMRTPNDIRLAENVDEIDLILGGHDHVYEINKVNGKYVLKSGTDFREFSVLTLNLEEKDVTVDIEKVVVDSSFEPDEELKQELVQYESVVSEKMDETLGSFTVELDGRFSKIRTSETNLGNFICDIMLAACNGDIALLNSGTLRSDRVHPVGDFLMRDLMTILPMLDPLCVLQVTGKEVLAMLENSVSQYPKLEGRFPQVAGIQFVFDPEAPPGSRIIKDIVKVGDEYLEEDSTYRLVTKAYLHQGRDGYSMLIDTPVLQDEEQCPMLSTAVQNHFRAIQTRMGRSRRNSTHRQSLVLLSRRHSLIRNDDAEIVCGNFRARTPLGRSLSTDSALSTASTSSWRRSRGSLKKQDSVHDLEDQACKLAPEVDGRILVATDELVETLRQKRASHAVSVIQEEDEPTTPGTPQTPLSPLKTVQANGQ